MVLDPFNPLRPPTDIVENDADKFDPPSQPLSPLDEEINNQAAATRSRDNDICPICKIVVEDGVRSVNCNMCCAWVHQVCLHMEDDEYEILSNEDEGIEWFCARCRLIKANKIKWGEYTGEESIRKMITSSYETIIGWKKNIFRLPRGKCGEDFIKELTRLINLFVDKTPWHRVALPLIHIFVPIMLQLPSP